MFTETNPDKGTETMYASMDDNATVQFTEINPDKGTETPCSKSIPIKMEYSLQKLTPIRGRKHSVTV